MGFLPSASFIAHLSRGTCLVNQGYKEEGSDPRSVESLPISKPINDPSYESISADESLHDTPSLTDIYI